MKDEDIHAEYPFDTDDEYVTEKGFQPTLPGEYTRLSSALALFRGTRILGKVLEKIYPAASSHELSLQQMSVLEAELDEWSDSLPPHLKLTFRQDKPSTDITGSRSPLLALAYYYIRILIQRPAVGSSLAQKAAPALISVSESSKHIVQIIQLLEERRMSFSFCLNKADVLILCGMTLLYQCLDLKSDSKVLKDDEKLVNAVIKISDRIKAPGSYDLKRVAAMLITVDEPVPSNASRSSPPKVNAETSMAAPPARASPPAAPTQRKTLPYALGRLPQAAASETDLLLQQEKLRRMTMSSGVPTGSPDLQRTQGRSSFDSARPAVADHRLSMSHAQMLARVSSSHPKLPQNLDYLQLNMATSSQPSSPVTNLIRQQQQAARTSASAVQQIYATALAQKANNQEWEAILEAAGIDNPQLNVYDAALYASANLPLTETPLSTTSMSSAWSPDPWDLSNFGLSDANFSNPAPAQSVMSLSDESSLHESSLGSDEMTEGLGGLGLVDYRNSGMLASASDYHFDTNGGFGI
jgi:hypothetical protein